MKKYRIRVGLDVDDTLYECNSYAVSIINSRHPDEVPLTVEEIKRLGMMTRAINLGLEIDMDLAREVVGRAVKPSKQKAINFDMVVEAAAEKFRLNSDVIFSKSRVKDVADARMMIMYLAQKLLGLSTGSIGRKLGRQHSTVIHGIKSVMERMQKDTDYADMVLEVERGI